MMRFPLFVDLRGRHVLVVGAGTVGIRRARELSRSGARVTIVDPRPGRRLPRQCRWLQRRFRPSDALGSFLVIAATDDESQNARIAACARAAGALVNLASDPGASEVWIPAVLRRGPLVIAVGTGAASPAVAARIRRELARTYGPAYGGYLRLLDEARKLAKRRIPQASRRQTVLRRLAAPALMHLFIQRGRKAVQRTMWKIVERAAFECDGS